MSGTFQPLTFAAFCCCHWELHQGEFPLLQERKNPTTCESYYQYVLCLWFDILEFVFHSAFKIIALHFHMGIQPITTSGHCHQMQNRVTSSSAYMQLNMASSQTCSLRTSSFWFLVPPYPRYLELSPKLAVTSHILLPAQTHPSLLLL